VFDLESRLEAGSCGVDVADSLDSSSFLTRPVSAPALEAFLVLHPWLFWSFCRAAVFDLESRLETGSAKWT
jgi:hypothetical protein